VLEAMANKGEGRLPWHTDRPTPELNSIAMIINWMTTDGDGRADELDDKKPIEVDTPRSKQAVEDLPTLEKKLRTLPSSLSSDLTELSRLNKEQMVKNNKFQIMQFVGFLKGWPFLKVHC